MARTQIDGGCHSPLPEMMRSCVRKLSWTCDSDSVVWAKRWYFGPLSTHKSEEKNLIWCLSMHVCNERWSQ